MSSQYFAEQPAAAHRPGTVHVVLPDTHLRLATDSGVFSPERLDPGTRLLLETAPPPPADGDLLDLGSGYGPLALVMASRAPQARVWAVDVNRRALELCERNAADAGLTTVRIIHGKGTGALRRAVEDLLAGHPLIAEHRPGAASEGGGGATVATLTQG